jgi:hypothetical protein
MIYTDKKMVLEIIKSFEKYNKIFIVFGSAHAVCQERALRKLFENF